MNEIKEYVESVCRKAKVAAPFLATADTHTKNRVLEAFAKELRDGSGEILIANEADVSTARENGLGDAMCDRLRLTADRITAIAKGIESLISLPDPVGCGTVTTRPNSLVIKKISVPLGVVGVIYEARPNVSADIAGLCIKSGNAVVLRGGKEALNSNKAITAAAGRALESLGLPRELVSLIEMTDREGADVLMQQRHIIDVLIPRGGKGLIQHVVASSKVPVIETGAGNCHIYIHKDVCDPATLQMAVDITANAKLSRPSVCNAVETVLVHHDAAKEFLPLLKKALGTTEIRGCAEICRIIDATRATEEDWETEYNDYILAVKIVSSIEEAVAHINLYSTGHSEAIITKNLDAADFFTSHVDSACVYVNASTRFTDGGEFGFGAEVGISTQKLHARGPMGLEALTTTKYIINGNGQIR